MLDEWDLRILNALQVNPRVTWAQLSPVVNMDASNLSRRWSRMTGSGWVWTTAFAESLAIIPRLHRGNEVIALVELNCKAGRRDEVIAELTACEEVMSIDCVSGEWDLLLTVGVLTIQEIDYLVTRRIGVLPGVTSTRMHFVHTLFRQGGDWRLNQLTTEQTRQLTMLRTGRSAEAVEPSAELSELCLRLQNDVRRPIADIAAELGRTSAWVSRGIDRLLRAQWVSWRVDCSHQAAGWQVISTTWLNVRANDLDRARVLHRVASRDQIVLRHCGPGESFRHAVASRLRSN